MRTNELADTNGSVAVFGVRGATDLDQEPLIPFLLRLLFEGVIAGLSHLIRAYFTEGQDISNRQTLIDVVGEEGLDRHQGEELLKSDDGSDAIKEAREQARRVGVEGVRFSSSSAS